MHAFLKTETAVALAASGCVACSGGDAIHLVDVHVGDEPDEGSELLLFTVPGAELAAF